MSEATLYREFKLTGTGAWYVFVQFVKANAKAFLERGKPLRLIVTDSDKQRSGDQNRRYWALLTEISEQAWVNGRKYDKETWHELFARQHLPLEEMILPDGEIIRRRVTTTKLKVGEFSDYMQKIEAYAASELGIELHG